MRVHGVPWGLSYILASKYSFSHVDLSKHLRQLVPLIPCSLFHFLNHSGPTKRPSGTSSAACPAMVPFRCFHGLPAALPYPDSRASAPPRSLYKPRVARLTLEILQIASLGTCHIIMTGATVQPYLIRYGHFSILARMILNLRHPC